MEYKLNYIQKILSTQDYLEFDKVLTVMLEEIKKNKNIKIIDDKGEVSTLITNWDELEHFKKMMIQIYGIYGYF
jgi:hypothetical protein